MSDEASAAALTAYSADEQSYRKRFALALVDADSFRRPLESCSLAECQGMCCYDGVVLSVEAARVLEEIAQREAPFFREHGLELPAQVITEAKWRGYDWGQKTAVRPHAFSKRLPDFPAHFSDTTCVFMIDDGRCSLQVLSEARGKHRWYYKPFPCWLHPVSVEFHPDRPIGVADEHSDPFILPDYPGYASLTHCGRRPPEGPPAYKVLDNELDFFGRVLQRDVAAEIRGTLEEGN